MAFFPIVDGKIQTYVVIIFQFIRIIAFGLTDVVLPKTESIRSLFNFKRLESKPSRNLASRTTIQSVWLDDFCMKPLADWSLHKPRRKSLRTSHWSFDISYTCGFVTFSNVERLLRRLVSTYTIPKVQGKRNNSSWKIIDSVSITFSMSNRIEHRFSLIHAVNNQILCSLLLKTVLYAIISRDSFLF